MSDAKLSEEDLHRSLNSLNVPVQLKDIKCPTKEFMCSVFQYLLADLRLDMRNMCLPFDLLIDGEQSEVTAEAQNILMLVELVNGLLHPEGWYISFRDVVEPKPKKTKKILYYIVTFYNHYLSKEATFRDVVEAFEKKETKVRELTKENEFMEEKYQSQVDILKNMNPSKKEMQADIAAKRQRLKEYEKRKIVAEEDLRALKEKKKDLQTSNINTDVSIVNAKEKIVELDDVILTSPEKYTSEIQALKDQIRVADGKVKENGAALKEKKKNIEALLLQQEKNKKSVQMAQDVKEILVGMEETANSFKQVSRECTDESNQVQQLESDLKIKEELRSIGNSQCVKMQLNNKKQKESHMESLKSLKMQVLDGRKNLSCLEDVHRSLESVLEHWLSNLKEVVQESEHAVQETTKRAEEHKLKMRAKEKQFKADCKDIEKTVSDFF